MEEGCGREEWKLLAVMNDGDIFTYWFCSTGKYMLPYGCTGDDIMGGSGMYIGIGRNGNGGGGGGGRGAGPDLFFPSSVDSVR
jgi:hypothetical protein